MKMKSNFRKTSMLIVSILCCYTINARERRICDLEVFCKLPMDTVVNDILPLRFEMKNNGPDKMISGDEIIYTIYLIVDGRQTINQNIIRGYGNDSLDLEDKIVYGADNNRSITFNSQNRTEPYTVEICFQIFSEVMLNNGDSLILAYHDPNQANNMCCQTITVMPKKTTSIVNNSMEEADFLVYPNPAREMLYIQTKHSYVKGDLHLTISDLTGRILLEKRYMENQVAGAILPLDLNQFPVGIYNMSLRTQNRVTNRKITVSR